MSKRTLVIERPEHDDRGNLVKDDVMEEGGIGLSNEPPQKKARVLGASVRYFFVVLAALITPMIPRIHVCELLTSFSRPSHS